MIRNDRPLTRRQMLARTAQTTALVSWAAACDWVRCWYGDPGGCWSLPGLARPAAVPRRNVRAPNVRNCDPRPVPGT